MKRHSPYVTVLFAGGEERRVPAAFRRVDLSPSDPAFYTHRPKLEPVPIEGYRFLELLAGGWVAIEERNE